jgi:hypothetical protein
MNPGIEKLLQALKATAEQAEVGGLSGCAFSVLLAAARRHADGPLLCITPGPELAEDIQLDLAALAPDMPVIVAPLIDAAAPDRDAAWMAVTAHIAASDMSRAVVLAPAATLLEALPAPEALARGNLALRPGDRIEIEPLFRRLVEAGFSRVEQVDAPGQFARRGGIVDLFPHTRATPLRIELMGNVIESVRAFEPATQRSFESLPGGAAFPLLPQSQEARTAWLPDYLPGAQVVAAQADAIRERLRTLASFRDDPESQRRIASSQELLGRARHWVQREAEAGLECVTPINLGDGFAGVGALAMALTESGRRVLLFCGAQAEMRLAQEGLADALRDAGDMLELLPGDIGGGRVFPAHAVALLSLHELLGRARRRQMVEPTDSGGSAELMDEFVELEALRAIGAWKRSSARICTASSWRWSLTTA